MWLNTVLLYAVSSARQSLGEFERHLTATSKRMLSFYTLSLSSHTTLPVPFVSGESVAIGDRAWRGWETRRLG